jgi:hypothetical protein
MHAFTFAFSLLDYAMLDAIFNNQWLLFSILIVCLFGFSEVGHRVGLKIYETHDERRRSQIDGVQTAILGLLGLLLAFTFAMATGRYDRRHDLVEKEANAISTAWQSAGFLPEQHQAPVKQMLRDYIGLHLKYEELVDDSNQLAEGKRLTSQKETALWEHARAAAIEAPTPITQSFISALSDMSNTAGERFDALRNLIPSLVWLLLIVVASVGCFTSSYGSGAQGARSFFTSLLLPGIITVVVMLIYDLSHSQQGFIHVSQQPMIDLKTSMDAAIGK